MKEFLGFGGYQRIPEGKYTWQHLTFVLSLIAIMIVLAVFIGIYNRKKELKKASKKARLTRVEASEEEKSSDQGSGLDAEIDFETARFYVISDEKAYAERYIRRDTSPLKTGLYCALIVLFFAVIIIAMPTLLKSIRGMV